jgi:hypothetical protein
MVRLEGLGQWEKSNDLFLQLLKWLDIKDSIASISVLITCRDGKTPTQGFPVFLITTPTA